MPRPRPKTGRSGTEVEPQSLEPSNILKRLYLGACASLIALIFLCLAWELWLAPVRPGGSWLALKALPLLLPLMGILHGKRYTYQWSSMLILAYFAEGVVRAAGDSGPAATMAIVEITLTLIFFFSTVFYAKLEPGKPR